MAHEMTSTPLLPSDADEVIEKHGNGAPKNDRSGSNSKPSIKFNSKGGGTVTTNTADAVKNNYVWDGTGDATGFANSSKSLLRSFYNELKTWHLVVTFVIFTVIVGTLVLLAVFVPRGGGKSDAGVTMDVVTAVPGITNTTDAPTESESEEVDTESEVDRPTSVQPTPLVQCDEQCKITTPANNSIFRVIAPNATAVCFGGKKVTLPTDEEFQLYVRPGISGAAMTFTLGAAAGQPCPLVTWRLEDGRHDVAILRPGSTNCNSRTSGLCSIPWRWVCAQFYGILRGWDVWDEFLANFEIPYVRVDGAPQRWRFCREVADTISDGHLYACMSAFVAFENFSDMDEETQMRTIVRARVNRFLHSESLAGELRRFESTTDPIHGCYGDPKMDE